jgi:hypothetical protein
LAKIKSQNHLEIKEEETGDLNHLVPEEMEEDIIK